MLYRLAVLLGTTLSFSAASADGSLVVQPHEIKSMCRDLDLVVAIDPLIRATRSRTQLVKVGTGSEGMCSAGRQYVQFTKPTAITFATRIDKVDYLVKANPCIPATMQTCSAVYREALVETVKVKIKDLELTSKVEVPGTQRDHLVQWGAQFCPPYRPDCDL